MRLTFYKRVITHENKKYVVLSVNESEDRTTYVVHRCISGFVFQIYWGTAISMNFFKPKALQYTIDISEAKYQTLEDWLQEEFIDKENMSVIYNKEAIDLMKRAWMASRQK